MEENTRIDTTTYKDTVELIKQLIKNESNFLTSNNMLLNQINDDEDIYIIKEIINDTTEHIEILKEVFFGITNTHLNDTRSIYIENRSIIENYVENLKNSLFESLDSIKDFRKLLSHMPDSLKYDLVMKILTNKIRHANMYNYLITKNLHIH